MTIMMALCTSETVSIRTLSKLFFFNPKGKEAIQDRDYTSSILNHWILSQNLLILTFQLDSFLYKICFWILRVKTDSMPMELIVACNLTFESYLYYKSYKCFIVCSLKCFFCRFELLTELMHSVICQNICIFQTVFQCKRYPFIYCCFQK